MNKCVFLTKIGIEQGVFFCDWVSAYSKGVYSNTDGL